jgi:predicted glycosyltransferase
MRSPPLSAHRANTMMKKSNLLYYCRINVGSQALRRSLAVAHQLSDTFDVTLLSSDCSLEDVARVSEIRCVQLPDLGVDPDRAQEDFNEAVLQNQRIVARRDFILDLYLTLKPRVVIVEEFPFSNLELAAEILPIIERAKYGMHGDSLVVCTTDGIHVSDHANFGRQNDRAATLLNKYFDLILVQSDSVFARLEEFFQPGNTLVTPLFHTGFVSPNSCSLSRQKHSQGDSVLVSAGDGRNGSSLFRAAIEAQKTLWHTLNLPMTIAAGERMSETTWRQLNSLAADVPGITMTRIDSDLREHIHNARWSVNQCGYSTALDIIETGTPSLFVPDRGSERLQQLVRAKRLVYWGAGRLLMPHHLNGASLANEILQLTRFEPRNISFSVDGASKSAELISEIVLGDFFGTAAAPDSARPWSH